MVKKAIWLFLLCFVAQVSEAQVTGRLGFSAGPTFGLTDDDQVLSQSFFTASRAGVQGGINGSFTFGERIWSRVDVNYSRLNFAFRQNANANFGVDMRWGMSNLELPVKIGFGGFLGSLRHREFIGLAYTLPLAFQADLELTGDSAAAWKPQIIQQYQSKGYLSYMAGMEIGTEFDNDGALFFGLSFRWNPQQQYSFHFDSQRFNPQVAATNGNFVMLEITYYLPRFSYWFKRDFTY